MFTLLFACSSKNTPLTSKEVPTEGLVLANVAFDYSVGSLSHFDVTTQVMTEDITSVSGDPFVVYDEGSIWQLNRFQYDTIRKYSPTDLRIPLQEVSIAIEIGSANPHDVEVCSNALFVSLYGTDFISVLDPQNLQTVDSIDISDWADEDGIPEASSIVQWEDTIFIGLQRLDRNSGFEPLSSLRSLDGFKIIGNLLGIFFSHCLNIFKFFRSARFSSKTIMPKGRIPIFL